MKPILYIIQSLRLRQWTKNLFFFAVLLFSRNITNTVLLSKTILGFFIFCLISGAVYLINDILDRDRDRLHPLKSQRPIAAGHLSLPWAAGGAIVIATITLSSSFLLDPRFFFILLLYFFLQLIYSVSLKHIVILDVLVLAIGFLLRVIAGGIIVGVEISSWLLICTTLLALFLGLAKRRHELISLETNAHRHRKVLKEYSPYLLDQMISVVTASTVIAYALYTISEVTIEKFGTKNLIFTVPFVLYGIFRYLYLIHQKDKGGNPEVSLLTDMPLLIDIFCWIISIIFILYGKTLFT